MTTLEEVGAAAGVSRATVSRVINGSPRVSPEAKVAVERAIDKLGYSPNRAARSLVTRRTDTVALSRWGPGPAIRNDRRPSRQIAVPRAALIPGTGRGTPSVITLHARSSVRPFATRC